MDKGKKAKRFLTFSSSPCPLDDCTIALDLPINLFEAIKRVKPKDVTTNKFLCELICVGLKKEEEAMKKELDMIWNE